ncbi:MAG TPA: GldG family protein [Polyangia bacterium]|nr:GldG family protein [Polyangia bacterium]
MAADNDNEAAKNVMDKRKRSYASNATIYALFTIGAIVLANLIGTRLFARLDLTQNGIYTLSSASKDLVRNLPDPLTIKAYISKDLPPELVNVSRYTRDLMDEYRSASKGKIRFEAYDPGSDKKIEEAATSCKVAKLQLQVMRSQKFEVSEAYLGLCLEYNGNSEAVPQVTQAEGLEYMVTSLIKRMSQKKRKMAFTTGHNESDTAQGYTFLKHFLDQEYDVTSVNPSATPIPDDVDALVVGGPKQPFDEKGAKEIDAFLMKGKGAIFLIDGMAMSTPQGNMPELQQMQPKIGQPNNTGLGPLLEKYGFKVGEDFIFDKKQAAPGLVDFGGRKMIATVPAFLVAEPPEAEGGKDKDFSVLDGVTAIIFPWGSSVSLTGPLAGGKPTTPGARLWTLASSSDAAWKQTGFFFFSPNAKFEETKDRGPFAMGYAFEGTLKSAFAPATAPGMSGADQPGAPPSESRKPVHLVVVGDSDFASDDTLQSARFVPEYQNGSHMLFNAISWAIEDETLTAVRTKTVGSRPLHADADDKAGLYKVINIAGVPLLFIGFGLARWRMRRGARLQQKL